MGTEPIEYCREVETYLCRKNDGHLIRIVGPSFELVSSWADRGVPLKVAFEGIDRYFERYYRHGPRRRPVKIDFCDADVLDVFGEWRRAVGVSGHEVRSGQSTGPPRGASLPEHLERAVLRLTSARASGTLGTAFDSIIDDVAKALEGARSRAGGIRGAARRDLIARLAALDTALLLAARASLDTEKIQRIDREAEEEVRPFRSGMTADAYERARAGAADRLIRSHLNLPTIVFS